MIEWFNDNEGFVLSLLTGVYVVATIVILYVMTRSNHLTARSVEHAQQVHREQTRPYVVFDIVVRDRGVYIDLQNHGSTPAINVAVTCSPTPVSLGNDHTSTLLRNTIAFLAPGRQLTDFLDTSPNFHTKNSLLFTGSVSYSDTGGNQYAEDFALDLGYYPDTHAVGRKEVGEELNRIREELRDINRAIGSLNNTPTAT